MAFIEFLSVANPETLPAVFSFDNIENDTTVNKN